MIEFVANNLNKRKVEIVGRDNSQTSTKHSSQKIFSKISGSCLTKIDFWSGLGTQFECDVPWLRHRSKLM